MALFLIESEYVLRTSYNNFPFIGFFNQKSPPMNPNTMVIVLISQILKVIKLRRKLI